MPKDQSTAAKTARQAARDGAKYTEQLRKQEALKQLREQVAARLAREAAEEKAQEEAWQRRAGMTYEQRYIDDCRSDYGARSAARRLVGRTWQQGGGTFWHERAVQVIAPLLRAAGLDGRPLETVAAWVENPEDDEPERILAAIDERAAEDLRRVRAQLAADHVNTANAVRAVVLRVLSRGIPSPSEGVTVWDPAAFPDLSGYDWSDPDAYEWLLSDHPWAISERQRQEHDGGPAVGDVRMLRTELMIRRMETDPDYDYPESHRGSNYPPMPKLRTKAEAALAQLLEPEPDKENAEPAPTAAEFADEVIVHGYPVNTPGGDCAVKLETPDGQEIGELSRYGGYAWGYGGIGPHALARDILATALGERAHCAECEGVGWLAFLPGQGEIKTEPHDPARHEHGWEIIRCTVEDCDGGAILPWGVTYQAFTDEYVACWPQDQEFTVTIGAVRTWITRAVADEAADPGC